ncbi:MAG: 30S ribosomal protein S2 [Patescibacteria group bacterium]
MSILARLLMIMIKEKKTLLKSKKTEPSKKKDVPSVKKIKDVKIEMPSLEEMLKQGVHFGHRTSKWNPKMEQYIFTTRNNVHIIDLEQTYDKFKQALNFIQDIKKKNGTIIFVGTKIAVKEITKKIAEESKAFHITERWIGGTLTNFPIISERLKYFRELEEKKKTGGLKKYVKKEQHEFDVELQKLERRFGGIKNMTKLPDALLVVDAYKEKLAIKEARMKNIPIIGLCDTNANPTIIDYPVPMNDDSISSLTLILETIAKVLK